jgi:UDP-N-acetylmuramyl tripeptide synthase
VTDTEVPDRDKIEHEAAERVVVTDDDLTFEDPPDEADSMQHDH